jgi:hypothetical protein
MDNARFEESILFGPESFEEVQAQKQEFLRCAQNITLEDNPGEQNYYLERLNKLAKWRCYWVEYTRIEVSKMMYELPTTIILKDNFLKSIDAEYILSEKEK